MVNQLRLPILLLVILLRLPNQLQAQTLDPTFHIPEIYCEASVADVAQMPNGQYVVAGNFIRVNGQAGTGLARFDASGTTDQTFRQNLSGATVKVEKVYPMANGQLLVQGNYTAGTVQRLYLFRLNADGTLDATFNLALPGAGMYPNVTQAIVQPDGRILVMGLYLSGYSVSFELLRVMSDGSRDTSFSATLNDFSQDQLMALQTDGKIVLGGSLSEANGIRYPFFARLNSNGSTDTSYHQAAYTNARLYINSIALDANNSLLVGGLGINVVNGQATPLFRMLSTGAFDPGFTCPASLLGRDCDLVSVQHNGQISVLMNTYSSVTNLSYSFNSQLFRLQSSGAVDAAFQPGTGPDYLLAGVRGLASGNLFTWGYFNNFAGQRRTVALLQPSGSVDAGFAPMLQNVGSVEKIVRQADGKLVITGRFNSIDGHLTDRVARVLPSGQPDVSFAWRQPNSASWGTTALAVQADGQVLLAGSSYTSNTFTGTSLNVQTLFTRLTTSGAADASFVPALTLNPTSSPNSSRIQLLAEQANGQLVVGGTFTDANGKANLTRLLANGSIDPTFTPPIAQPAVYSGLVQANGAIACVVPVAGTSFSQTIERLLPNGGLDPIFAYTPPAQVSQGLPYTGLEHVYQIPTTGGYITSGVLGATQVLGRTTASGADEPGFSAPFQPIAGPALAYAAVNEVAIQSDGRLVVGGYMQQSSQFGAPATLLARLEPSGQLDASFSTSFITNPVGMSIFERYSVSDVLVQPDGAIVVAGNFPVAGGQAVTGLVRLLPAGVLAVGSARLHDAAVQAWPVPAHDALHLRLPAGIHPQRVSLRDALGRPVVSQVANGPGELMLPTAALARGLYVVYLECAEGLLTQKVVLE